MPARDIELKIYNDYSTSPSVLLDDLSGEVTSLTWTTGLHGGFKQLKATVPMALSRIWLYLDREGFQGRHFKHVVVKERNETRWEGRLVKAGIQWSLGSQQLEITALGYWNSMKDQRVTTRDYTGGSAATTDTIIKAMLTANCPDISSTQTNINTAAGSRVLTLPVDKYAQDHIIDTLAPLGDTSQNVYYFAIWEDRIPYYAVRNTTLTWETSISEIQSGTLMQDALNLRNEADAFDGSTRSASAADSDSQAFYPDRDAVVPVAAGVVSTAATDARTRFINERKAPLQSSQFTIAGEVIRQKEFGMPSSTKSAVRAGDVIRINDLVPVTTTTAESGTSDNLRIFHILETEYNAITDRLSIVPNRAPNTLRTIIPRLGGVEPTT